MANLLHYRLRCTIEQEWKYWWLSEDDAAPTTCPTDAAHAVESGSVSIIGRKDDGRVTAKIEEEKVGQETGGNYAAETIAWDAVPGISYKSVTTLLPIAMLTAALETRGLNDGDEIGLEIGPNTPVGALPADLAASTKTIPLPATMKAAWQAGVIWAGLVIHLVDGDNDDCFGILLDVDEDADTFTTSMGSENVFLAASPTLIKVTATMSPGVLGAGTNNKGWVEFKAHGFLEEFGDAKIGGTRIDAGKEVRCRYNNKGQANVRVVIRLEYLY